MQIYYLTALESKIQNQNLARLNSFWRMCFLSVPSFCRSSENLFLRLQSRKQWIMPFPHCHLFGYIMLSSTFKFSSVQFSSVAQSCPTLCNPMNSSIPGLPVHHHLPEFTQTHVHRVGNAIQPSHPLPSPFPPAPNPSQHQSFPMSQLFT